jgi:hypothetical protein
MTTLIQQGNPGYSKQQKELRAQAAATPTVTQAPATPMASSMPVSADSAARGVIGYNAGGGAMYGPGGALTAGTATSPSGAQSFSNTGVGAGQRGNVVTTLSNTSKMEQVPKDINALNSLSQKGQVSDGENIYNANGTLANLQAQTGGTVQDTTPEQDYYNSASYKLYQDAVSNLDASTASLVANAQRQAKELRDQTNEVSRIQSKAMNNALLMGGATGQGASARYAPVSSEGILAAQEGYRVKQIMAIDAKEQQAIEAAREAQRTGKFQLLSAQVQEIEQLRTEKIKAAQELNKTIAAQNEKMREKMYTAEVDNSISELYSSGFTDVQSIMTELRKNGISISSKEVRSALDNIVPEGLDDMVKNARENGESPERIAQAIQSGDINKAYQILGGSAAKAGTGIVAEYNFYKRDAISRGQVPVDFNTYQNMDANRKKSIAKAGTASTGSGSGSSGISNVSSDALALAEQVVAGLMTIKEVPSAMRAQVAQAMNHPTLLAKKNDELSNYVSIVDELLGMDARKKITGPLDQFTGGVFGKAAYAKNLYNQISNIVALSGREKLKGTGTITDFEAKQLEKAGSALGRNLSEKDFDAELKKIRDILSSAQSRASLPGGTVSKSSAQTLIEDEDAAEKAVINFGVNNPSIREQVRQMERDGIPFIQIKAVLGI